jgi:hypothetical protein
MRKLLHSLALTAGFLIAVPSVVMAQLSGTYTIDLNGSGATNYTSYTAALSALSTNGVNGPVVFNVASGTYTEQVTFESYSGVSHVNTITFQSDPSNASSPILTFAPTSSAIASNFTARFNGAKYIILDGLTIETSGTSYGRLFNIAGTTNQSLTIQNCTLTGYSGSTSSSFAIFYMSAARFDTLTIDNNTITNGSYMGYFYGSSSNMSEQFVFTNNTVTGFMSYGVYTGYVNSGEISHNTIAQSSTSSTFCYGVRLYGLSTNSSPGYWEVHDNDISIPSYGYGMYLYYVYGSASNPNKIYNNAVVFGSGTSYNYGIYMYHPSNLEIFNNTIRTGTAYSSNRPVYASASTSSSYPAPSVSIKNNIFANDVQGYPMYFYVSSVFSSSYIDLGTNVFYTPTTGVTGYYFGTTNNASFAAYQAASGDSTSMFADPIFTGSDYHVEGLAPNATASVISYITTDLDGDSRDSLTPDIGADEFLPPACPMPSGTTFGAITPYTAAMSWLGTSSAYDIEYGPTGFVQGTGSTATATSTSTTLSVNPATTYDVYIRANCLTSGNGYSGWYGPASFTTPCLAQSLPISESFTSWTPACWDLSSGTGVWWQHYTTGVSMARAYYWGNNDKSFIMESPLVNLSVDGQIKFDWSHSGQYASSYPYDSLSVRVRSMNSATWTTLTTLKGSTFATTGASTTSPSSTLDNEIVFIPTSFTGDTVVVQFYAWSDFGPDLFLDNIVIEEVPACPPPTGLSVIGTGATTATITYIPSAGNTSYTVEWGPCGYTPGTGATTTTTNDTVTVTGLFSNTCYDFYVFANCGSSAGTSPVGPVSTTTLCQAATMPYSDDFQNWSSTSPLPCWDIDGGTQTVLLHTDASSNNSMRWYFWSWTAGNTGIATSRPVYISSAATVSFDWSHSNQYYTSYNDMMTLRVREENSSTWDTIVYLNGQSFGTSGSATTSPGSYANEYHYLDTSYVGHNVIFEFYGQSGWGPDVFIDNFNVDFVPTCPDPVLTNTGWTATSGSFSWASPTGSTPLGSTIIWGPQGFYNGTGTPGTWMHGVSSPYTITGLSPNTFYDVYVIDSCGGNDFSGMVGPVTFKTDCLAQLSGTYTIDANGTGANNFATLDSATSFLAGCGISGPVTFNMAAGTYSGSIALGDIIGGSSTNTVTFNGPTTGAAVINATAGQNAAKFDGTSYVTLNNLTLSNQLSHVIWLTNEAQHITINGCTIIADTVGTSSTTGSPIAASASATSATSYGNNASHITITNNVVKGGYYGIVANGASTSGKISDWTITGNDVSLQYFYNIRCYYTTDFTVSDNQCLGTRASGGYGVMMYYSNDFEIVGNNLPSKSYGLYLYYPNVYDASGSTGYTPTTQSLVANNMVKGGTYGSYMYSPRYINLYHNTYSGNTYGVYLGTTTTAGAKATHLDIRNNIFASNTNYSIYVPTIPDSMIALDYNVYNTNGANLAYWAGAKSTLSAWQSSNSAFNANSSDQTVTFLGTDDLHLITGANNLGTPIASVTTDIDGDVRSTTTPDIGADEYSPITNDARTEKIIGAAGGCGDSAVAVYVAFQNFGLDTITAMGATVEVTDPNANVTTLTGSYSGSLAPMAFDTIFVGTVNTYAGGNFDFLGYTQLANDGRTSNDTTSDAGYFLPYEPVVTGLVDTVCASQDSVTLSALAVPGTTYGWFNSPTDTTLLGTGDNYTVPVAGQTSYYVKFLNTADSATTSLAGGNGSAGNMFNIINTSGAPLTITGFAQGPGTGNSSATGVPLVVYYTPGDYTTQSAASWSQLASGTVNLTSSAATGYLPVSVTIPAGATYGFFVGLTSGSVQYTNGTGTAGSSPWYVHPKFTITEGLGGSYPNPVNSPRCWNGQVFFGSAGCSDIRAEVSFAINTDTAVAVGSGVETNPATGQFDFDATGSNGHVFNWSFGDGATGTGMMTQHNYGTAGVYTVSLVVTDTVCGTSDSTSFQVTSTISVGENGLNQVVRAFPNPSNGQVVVSISGTEAFEGSIQVVNGVGQILVNEPVAKQDGVVEIPMDLRNLPKGVYTIRLSGEQGESNLRVVLQ